MKHVTDIFLRIGILLASIGSVYMLGLMLAAQLLPIEWNRYNALTFFSATLFFAAARHILRLDRSEIPDPVRVD